MILLQNLWAHQVSEAVSSQKGRVVMDGRSHVPKSISEENMKKILLYLDEVKYGSITIVIHDGKVVLVEKQEKFKIS
jgi:hypothetical protein